MDIIAIIGKQTPAKNRFRNLSISKTREPIVCKATADYIYF